MSKHRPRDVEAIESGWREVLLVCRQCGDDGFGKDGEDDLRRAVKRELRTRGLRGVIGVVAVDCFGVCPKKAVMCASSSRPEELLVVPEGADVAGLLDRLGCRPTTSDTPVRTEALTPAFDSIEGDH